MYIFYEDRVLYFENFMFSSSGRLYCTFSDDEHMMFETCRRHQRL